MVSTYFKWAHSFLAFLMLFIYTPIFGFILYIFARYRFHCFEHKTQYVFGNDISILKNDDGKREIAIGITKGGKAFFSLVFSNSIMYIQNLQKWFWIMFLTMFNIPFWPTKNISHSKWNINENSLNFVFYWFLCICYEQFIVIIDSSIACRRHEGWERYY